MSEHLAAVLIGAAILPGTVLIAFLIWLAGFGGGRFYHRFLSWKLVPLQRCYAYRVTSATGRLSHELIGSVFVERRNLGPEHTFVIEHDGTSTTTAVAVRVSGGGRYGAGWDDETVRILDDEPLEPADR